ncbi:juvenile hormone acid O-methyltransferase, partial [Trichonephila inaurata madagascariensis]
MRDVDLVELTYQLVLPLFPDVKKILAVDLVPVAIEFAKKHNYHPLIEYNVANLEDWSTLKHWEGEITKLVSVYCINWVKDQQNAFRNIFKLLKKGVEAAIVFAVESRFYDAILEVQNNPKWSSFLKTGQAKFKEELCKIAFDVSISITLNSYENAVLKRCICRRETKKTGLSPN